VQLGICTPYRRCEETQVALRLAQWAEDRDIDVSIRPTTTSPARLGVPHDDDARACRDMKFTEWARQCSTIIWTASPIYEQVEWALKHKIHSIIYALWLSTEAYDMEALKIADAVLVPNQFAANGLQGPMPGQRIIYAPYDPGVPPVAKDPRLQCEQRWVFLPLFDREPYKTEMTVVEVMGRMLYEFDDTILTVAYNASTLALHARRRLDQFSKYFGPRVRQLAAVPLARRAPMFQYHDLTVWPVHWDDVGIIGLTSMTVGTPVIAFYYPPLSEFMLPTNSVGVQVSHHTDLTGMPRIEPNYDGFENILHMTLQDRKTLPHLHQTVLQGLPERRTLFGEALVRVMY